MMEAVSPMPVNPYPADHDDCRFYSVFLVNQIPDIGN